MNTPLNTILNWFQTGDFPTEAQFVASWSSFRHKDDAVPADQVSGLSTMFQQTANIEAFNTHIADSNAHAGYLAKLDATNLTATNVNEWRNKLGVGQLSQNAASVDDADHVGNVYTKNQSNDLYMANADFVNDDGKILAEKIESEFVRKLQGDFKALINTSEATPDATFTKFVTLKPDGTPGIKNLSDITGTDTLQRIVDRGNSTTKSIVFNPAQGRAGELNFNAATQSYNFGNINSPHTGELNSSYGYNALSKVSSGSENTAYGSYTGVNLSTGKENTFAGTYAGENATTGNYNTMIGAESGNSTTTGYKNTFLGTFSGFHNTAGAYNTVLGYSAGNNSVLNDKNTLIGAYAGNGISGYNNVMIGVGSGLNNGNISNKLIIHNNHTHYNYSNTSEGNYITPQHGQLNRALITGDFVDRWVRFNAGYFQVGNPGDNNNDITINPATGITATAFYNPQNDNDYTQKIYVDNNFIKNYFQSVEVNPDGGILHKGPGTSNQYDLSLNFSDDEGFLFSSESNSFLSNFNIIPSNFGINIIEKSTNNVSDVLFNYERGLTSNNDYSEGVQELDYVQKIFLDKNYLATNGTENPQYYTSNFEFNKGSGSGGGFANVRLVTSTTSDHLNYPNQITEFRMNVEEGIQIINALDDGSDTQTVVTTYNDSFSIVLQSAVSFKFYDFNESGIYSVYKVPTSDGHFVQKKYVDDKKPYRSYTCLLATSGSPTPSPSFLVTENSVGNIVWTRTGEGEFTGTLNGAFPADKFVCFSQLSLDTSGSGSIKTIIAGRTDNNNIFIKIKNANDGTAYEPNGKFGFLEIRVYN